MNRAQLEHIIRAGRQKDYKFFEAAIHLELVSQPKLYERLDGTPLPDSQKEKLKQTILREFQYE